MTLLERLFGVSELRTGETVRYKGPVAKNLFSKASLVEGTGEVIGQPMLGLGVEINPIKPGATQLESLLNADGTIKLTRGNVDHLLPKR